MITSHLILQRRNASVSWRNMSKQKREQASERPAGVCDRRKHTPAGGLLRQNLGYGCTATVCTNWFFYSSRQTEKLILCSDAGYCQVTSCNASCTTTQTNWWVDHMTRSPVSPVVKTLSSSSVVRGSEQPALCSECLLCMLQCLTLFTYQADSRVDSGFSVSDEWRARPNEARNRVYCPNWSMWRRLLYEVSPSVGSCLI